MIKYTEFPFDLYTPTYTYKTPTPKVEKKPFRKPIHTKAEQKRFNNSVASPSKRQVTPFLQTIMRGKEADTRIKLSQQQGKQPDYKDLLEFHKMSEEIELTYGMPGEKKARDMNNNNNTVGGNKDVKQTKRKSFSISQNR